MRNYLLGWALGGGVALSAALGCSSDGGSLAMESVLGTDPLGASDLPAAMSLPGDMNADGMTVDTNTPSSTEAATSDPATPGASVSPAVPTDSATEPAPATDVAAPTATVTEPATDPSGMMSGTGGATGTGGTAGTTDPPEVVGADPEPAGLEGITRFHNDVRAALGLPLLEWDPALAVIAQGWADSCVDVDDPIGLVDHNEARGDDFPDSVGENIYGWTGQRGPEDAVDGWESESVFYDYDSNTCAVGEVCGHYTQLVWAASLKVGCGLSNCSGLTFSNTIVCNYSPAGNFNGQRPY